MCEITQCGNHVWYQVCRDGRFGSKVGQTGPKWDKSGAFSDQISVHLARGRLTCRDVVKSQSDRSQTQTHTQCLSICPNSQTVKQPLYFLCRQLLFLSCKQRNSQTVVCIFYVYTAFTFTFICFCCVSVYQSTHQ